MTAAAAPPQPSAVGAWLTRTNRFWFALYAMAAAFSTYACMYAFRKPYTVAVFEEMRYLGMDYKSLLIISQVIGYTASKFLGIKVVSEMTPGRRALTLLGLILASQAALLGFALTPAPWNIGWLLLNGLPLGMVWGLVFSYLEGRTTTDMLGAGLSVSFIVSSGFVKSAGKMVMLTWGVSEFWMPFVTGCLFLVPLLVATWLLNQIPPPTADDEAVRTHREPMDAGSRQAFLRRFGVSIGLLTLVYMLLTAYRDLRDNYAADIWVELGFGDAPGIFTASEVPIALLLLGAMGSLMWIRDNRQALFVNYLIILAGFALVGLLTLGFQAGLVSPLLWMIGVGLGLFMGYVPFNCILFERFIASHRTVANAGFLIYIADSFGYLSSVATLLVKNFLYTDISWYRFFVGSSYLLSVVGVVLTLAVLWHFVRNPPTIHTEAS
jgi:hypothetical protein